MENLEGVPPHCPADDVVMRDVQGGWRCPECGHLQQAQDTEAPPPFDSYDQRFR